MISVLRRIVQKVNTGNDLDQTINLIVAQIHDELHVAAASLFLVDEAKGEYLLAATEGLNTDRVGKARLKLGSGLVGLIGEREAPLNLANALEHERFQNLRDLGDDKLHAFLGVPFIDQGELIGILVVQRREAESFSQEEEAFLVTLAAQLSEQLARAVAKGVLTGLNTKRRGPKKETVLEGWPGSSGVAIGQAVVVYPPADLDAVPDRQIAEEAIEQEIHLFEQALSAARETLHQLQERAKSSFSAAENALFDAYLRILDSRSFIGEVIDKIKAQQWAQGALKQVIQRHVMHFQSLEDAYLQERASDFRDLGRRILAELQGDKQERVEYPKDTILVSDEVTATALVEVPQDRLIGVVSGSGSSNSHVAILARALGVPTVMGLTGTPVSQLTNQKIIVDGYNGMVYLSPSPTLRKEFAALVEEEDQLDEELESLRELPAETTDGHRIGLYVNTGLAVDSSLSLSAGAEGVGLYRTEVPFMIRDRFPSEQEQCAMYRQLLNTFHPRPVVMRTLDIGGDKSLAYFPVKEANPFLGWRGIRITLDHPEIFLQQIRAMLKASESLGNLSIMLPMISSVNEVDASLTLIHQAYDELKEEGVEVKMPPLGVMIEVPAAVYQAQELAKRVNFLSVGSNDLVQYLLAVDRNNSRVAELYNGLHPAVLRALQQVVKSSHRANRPVSICGELASDPMAAVLLLAMGFDTLSMSARSLLRTKWVIRKFSLTHAQQLLQEVLKMDDPVEIRCHMEAALDDAGLGGLIRAGK